MTNLQELYLNFSKVFSYPGTGYREAVQKVGEVIEQHYPDHHDEFQKFQSFITAKSDTDLEEIYIRTFDVQAVCCLEVGFLLFGEDYKRGQFMAMLKQVYYDKNVSLEGELPDFLPNLIRLLTVIDFGDAEDLVGHAIIPSLRKMTESFKTESGYCHILKVLDAVLSTDYMVESVVPIQEERQGSVC
ncbi:MAG: hypothetical protein H7A33_06405 [Deltaproteobacteria bacterium]|nr:hypothetical protein [Deltaproteobacteria bacterium]